MAISTLRRLATRALDAIIHDAHSELEGTRGAVVAFGKFVDDAHLVEAACVGNVAFQLSGHTGIRCASGVAYVLGMARGSRKPSIERFPFAARDTAVLFTDGLVSRTSLDSDLSLLREHPVIIAHQLAMRFARPDDDCLVLVVS